MPALTLAFIRFLLALGLLLLAAAAIVPVRAEIIAPEGARVVPGMHPVAPRLVPEGQIAASPVGFIEVLGDVPLMDGLVVDESSALVFDKPEGRVIEIAAAVQGVADSVAISDFYETALAQLGWLKTAENTYVRMAERLEISFIQGDSAPLVRFVLSPEKN